MSRDLHSFLALKRTGNIIVRNLLKTRLKDEFVEGVPRYPRREIFRRVIEIMRIKPRLAQNTEGRRCDFAAGMSRGRSRDRCLTGTQRRSGASLTSVDPTETILYDPALWRESLALKPLSFVSCLAPWGIVAAAW